MPIHHCFLSWALPCASPSALLQKYLDCCAEQPHAPIMLLFNKPPAVCSPFPPSIFSLTVSYMYSVTLPLGKCPLFLTYCGPNNLNIMLSQHLCVPLAPGIPPPNCTKLGLQPLLHPISRGGRRFPSLDYKPGGRRNSDCANSPRSSGGWKEAGGLSSLAG